jgi:hypothetical protein
MGLPTALNNIVLDQGLNHDFNSAKEVIYAEIMVFQGCDSDEEESGDENIQEVQPMEERKVEQYEYCATDPITNDNLEQISEEELDSPD